MTLTRLNHPDREVLHVRFEGRSEELDLTALNLNRQATDDQLRQAVARHFDRPTGYFADYQIVRTDQAIIVRPEAIYG